MTSPHTNEAPEKDARVSSVFDKTEEDSYRSPPAVNPQDLGKRARTAIKWSGVSMVARNGMGLISTAILARMLAPADYGLLGMAMVVTGFVSMFRDLGTSMAVVQRREISGSLLSTIFWANIATSVALLTFTILAAPLAAAFFTEPRLTALIMALAPTFVISSFSVVQQSLLQREVEFDRLAKVEVASSLASYSVGIACAFLGWGVWSLVAQAYAAPLTLAILLWINADWRPSRTFSITDLRAISRFSLNLVAYNSINYWARTADNALIGRFIGPAALGYYAMAYRLMTYPIAAVSGLVGRILIPVLSRLQDDQKAFREAYLRTVSAISIVTFPLLVGGSVLARPMVDAVFSSKWEPMVSPLIVLCLVGVNQSIATMTGNIYVAKGRTDLMFQVGSACTAIYLIGIVVGLNWGVFGVSVGYGIADLLATAVDYSFSFRLIGLTIGRFARAIQWPVLGCGVMAITASLASPPLLAWTSPRIGLCAATLLAVIVYITFNFCFNREQSIAFLSILRNRR